MDFIFLRERLSAIFCKMLLALVVCAFLSFKRNNPALPSRRGGRRQNIYNRHIAPWFWENIIDVGSDEAIEFSIKSELFCPELSASFGVIVREDFLDSFTKAIDSFQEQRQKRLFLLFVNEFICLGVKLKIEKKSSVSALIASFTLEQQRNLFEPLNINIDTQITTVEELCDMVDESIFDLDYIEDDQQRIVFRPLGHFNAG